MPQMWFQTSKLTYFKLKIPINSKFKQIFFQHAIQYSELMAMSQTYVISSDFGHDIFHGSVDQLIQWTSCLDCLINITLCYMLCYIGPMGPNLPISEIKPFNQSINHFSRSDFGSWGGFLGVLGTSLYWKVVLEF